jgi:hypothetical protein
MEHPYPLEEHDVRCMCGDPVALAYAWIKGYAENLNALCGDPDDEDDEYYGSVTVDELLEVADSQQPQSGHRWGGDYLSRGGAFEGLSVDPTFWKHYAVFRGIPEDKVEEAHFFSCSC